MSVTDLSLVEVVVAALTTVGALAYFRLYVRVESDRRGKRSFVFDLNGRVGRRQRDDERK